MGFVESLRNMIYDILHNLDRVHVDLIKSNGLNPLRIRHDSGGLIEFRNDGKAYYNNTEFGTGVGGGDFYADGSVPMTGNLAMGTNIITGLGAHAANGNAVRYEHLAADEHTQYLPINASRALTDDLYINATTPHVVLQEGGALRGSLYIESDDSTVLDAATADLTLASASDNINLFPAGIVQAKFTPTSFVSYQNVVCDKTTLPRFTLYEGADYRGGIYTNSEDDTVIDCEHGDVILGTYATTGGLIKFQPLNAGNALTISSTALTSTVPMTLGGNLSMGANNVYLDSGILRISNGTGLSGSIGFTTGVQNFIQRQLYSGTDYTLLSDQDYMHTWAILGTEKMHLSTADGLKMYTKIDMNGQDILKADIAGTESAYFIIDQDNAGAGVSSSLRFNRGSTDGDAAIWWDETDDEFQFESDVGVTVGNIKVAGIAATSVITGNHGTAATDEVVNVCYGTSATPPAASNTTEGALYIQYTA